MKVRLQAPFWDVSNANLSRIAGGSQFLNYRGLRGSRGFVCMETSARLIVGISQPRLTNEPSFDECVRDFWASARSKVSLPPGPPVCNKEDNHISKLDSLFEIPRFLIILLSILQVEDFLGKSCRDLRELRHYLH